MVERKNSDSIANLKKTYIFPKISEILQLNILAYNIREH